MISRKSELLAALEKCLYNAEEVFEEELKDVTSKCTLSKEHYSEWVYILSSVTKIIQHLIHGGSRHFH